MKPLIQTRIIVSWGAGQDSTGMLIGMYERGLRPWKIVFADVGNERVETYLFIEVFKAWLRDVGFPELEVVRYRVKDYKHWPHYFNLLENCLTNVTLPALAMGSHSCSKKWKIDAINAYLRSLPEVAQELKNGKLDKAIGFDDSPHERDRACRGSGAFQVDKSEREWCNVRFLLQEWHWTRQDCVDAIQRQGLPVPPKSSCFFCPGMKPWEVDTLSERERKICVIMEARVVERNYRAAVVCAQKDVKKARKVKGKDKPSILAQFQSGQRVTGWDKGRMLLPGHLGPVQMRTEGLWRSSCKGDRGSVAHPGSWSQYFIDKGLLPREEVERLWDATPRQLFTKADFERLGYRSWADWLEAILNPAPTRSRFAWKPERDENQAEFQLEWTA